MPATLRHCDCVVVDGESANVSGLDTFSSEQDYSPTMSSRRRRRREKISDLHATTAERRTFDADDAVIITESRYSRRTRPGSSASTMHEHERDASLEARERRWTSCDSWLRNGRRRLFSFSPSASMALLDSLDWPIFLLVFTLVFTVSDACSTRPSPKPRPPRPIWTPDLGPNVVKENCTDDYAELYCMNGGKCYRQKILETFIVNCECRVGFVGTRCQYRDVPDKYLPVQQRIETASIAGGVTVLIVIVTVFSFLAWLYFKRRRVSGTSSVGHV